MPTVAANEPGWNLPWSNWTSRDVFPTPLSPTSIVCNQRRNSEQKSAESYKTNHTVNIFLAGMPIWLLIFIRATLCWRRYYSYGPVSVCPSRVGVLSKRLDGSRWLLARTQPNFNLVQYRLLPFLLLEQRCGMSCQAKLRRPRRCRCSRTGWRHTCSAAVTKLFDLQLHLVIISHPRTVVLAIVFTV